MTSGHDPYRDPYGDPHPFFPGGSAGAPDQPGYATVDPITGVPTAAAGPSTAALPPVRSAFDPGATGSWGAPAFTPGDDPGAAGWYPAPAGHPYPPGAGGPPVYADFGPGAGSYPADPPGWSRAGRAWADGAGVPAGYPPAGFAVGYPPYPGPGFAPLGPPRPGAATGAGVLDFVQGGLNLLGALIIYAVASTVDGLSDGQAGTPAPALFGIGALVSGGLLIAGGVMMLKGRPVLQNVGAVLSLLVSIGILIETASSAFGAFFAGYLAIYPIIYAIMPIISLVLGNTAAVRAWARTAPGV